MKDRALHEVLAWIFALALIAGCIAMMAFEPVDVSQDEVLYNEKEI